MSTQSADGSRVSTPSIDKQRCVNQCVIMPISTERKPRQLVVKQDCLNVRSVRNKVSPSTTSSPIMNSMCALGRRLGTSRRRTSVYNHTIWWINGRAGETSLTSSSRFGQFHQPRWHCVCCKTLHEDDKCGHHIQARLF